ncbi:WAT1-related protein At1g09380 [Abrus precatorius]|uniref:WAT1-related protein n=1 Tax=Abrus precatorius TaxID=3816 RepID=A0A8B8L9U8_ABRPR|nr:WAT1-related protein At1g09380 [Abrus precatorius]
MATGLLPLFLMVLVQLTYAGMNITSKLAIESGTNPLILVAYRQIFATLSIAPFAYWLEWKTLPRMTKRVMLQILLCSLTGVTGNQILYFVGLKYSTATIACALSNLLPAFTFILAIIFRQENLKIKKMDGQAKVIGTILCVGGALLLSFYHGKTIGLGNSSIHWRYAEKMEGTSSSTNTNLLLGPLALIGSTLIWAGWFIIQADLSKKFPAPYTSTGCMCFMASFQCVFIALCFDHSVSAWSLRDAMRLSAALYAGILCTGLAYCLMSWAIERKGPLYVSVFTPLQLVLTAILSWALLQEKLFVGTAVGSLLIIVGLYSVLWGKSKEVVNKKEGIEVTVKEAITNNERDAKVDLELQSHKPSN